jgi:hypothetical protein
MTRSSALLVFAAALTVAACDQNSTPTEVAAPGSGVALARKPVNTGGSAVKAMQVMNTNLSTRHAKFRVDHVEWVTRDNQQQVGQIVFANDRGNKHTGAHFVPNDPRRGNGTNITYLVDRSDGATHTGTALTNAQTEAAIDRAMHTWDVATCSKYSIIKVQDTGADPDLVDGQLGFGEIGTPFADITHAGWMPAAFFDLFAPGGSTFIVGITFTFIFVDQVTGIPTDINHDGELDTAFHETYYNDAFPYGINADNISALDVETLVLHESGHGLDQDHFGKIFGTLSNGKLHFAPRAVMNASLSTPTHSLLGTDKAGHCSIWGSWPSR